MSEFVDAALGFPAVVFSIPLVVVVGYWLLVLLAVADIDLFDADIDPGGGEAEAGGFPGILDGLGLGGVPVTVGVTLLVVLAWFVSFAGTALLRDADLPAPVLVILSIAVLLVALVCAWLGTRALVLPLRRLFPDSTGASRGDFVGRVCVIRTGRVGTDFGQAEVTASDGSSAVIQVRQTGQDTLGAGSTALIFEYDTDGEFFWVMPYDPALDPDRPTT